MRTNFPTLSFAILSDTVGRSGGIRSTIEEQLVAALSAGKYCSDFNAKKIVSVARSVLEISSVDRSKVGPFFTQKIS
jgi:hypothetical protein